MFSPVNRNGSRDAKRDRGDGRQQSDCQKGLAMIKAELKKKHPAPVIATLRKALSDAETEEMEQDWSECMDYVKAARAAISK